MKNKSSNKASLMLYCCPWVEDNLNAVLGSHRTAQSKVTVVLNTATTQGREKKEITVSKLYRVFFHSIKNVMFTILHYRSL